MTKVLIAGIGNVLLGDDGVGPFVIQVLEAEYDFAEGVELADLGTPGLDLPVHLAGADAVILVDSAKLGGEAGDIRLFRKQEILNSAPPARIDPHSPALTESISLLDLMGSMPPEFLMIGMQGRRFDPGSTLSQPVRLCIPHIVDAVLRELRRLHVSYVPKATVKPRATWWDPMRQKLFGSAHI